ncbi:MAG TPA: hypothetical protein VD838_01810 [Anaeromyxobacteraceae bacterium]|nr:hypothetical protein [Anaeromyxobacteraceae bacterium]
MPRRKFSPDRVAEAIRAADGVLAVAARALKTSRDLVHRYVNDYPEVKAAYEEANETTLDLIENKLIEQAKMGLPEQVRFYLRTKGRARGYGDRLALDFDPSKLSDEQLAAIAAGKDPGAA